ncbi:UMP-CMP kinase [Aphelenchoides avenae]|nr:UMP-CMP kinase [Aphelenchus avenae]
MFRRKSDLNSACDAPGGDVLPSCACVNFTALSLGSRSVPVSSIDHTYTSTQKKHDVVFVVGPPGAGKGTQCARIQQEYGFKHLSVGDLLRAEQDLPGSQFGGIIEASIRLSGSSRRMTTVVPEEITCTLIENAMNACVGARGFLIDGFPRNQRNLDGWQRLMSDKVRVRFVLVLTAPTDVLLKRCLGRGRSDDNEETLKKRILRYNDETMPVVQHFEAQRIIRTIDGFRERNEVYEDISKVFTDAGVFPC